MYVAARPVLKSVWYAYPLFKHVSFGLIAEKHVKYLREYVRVERIDEHALFFIDALSNPVVLVQPYFYPATKWEKQLARKARRFKALIGVDVADSNRISRRAVELTDYATAMIVPSTFSQRAYVDSGVRVPVHVLPHGVDDDWITDPRQQPATFKLLEEYKAKHKLKILLSYVQHSAYRKGEDILYELYKRIRRERRDVALVARDWHGVKLVLEDETYLIKGWMTDQQQKELFDQADLYLLTSRGGGFEHPGLLALARGVPAIAARGGSWQDYMPDWGLVDSKPSGQVLPGNDIHTGVGVEMTIEKAVDKALTILDNLDEYKARADEHKKNTISVKFTWRVIAEKLKDIVFSYM